MASAPPFRPYLELSGFASDSMTLRIYGEPNVAYIFQSSTNATDWFDDNAATTGVDGETKTLLRNGKNPWFIRTRVAP